MCGEESDADARSRIEGCDSVDDDADISRLQPMHTCLHLYLLQHFPDRLHHFFAASFVETLFAASLVIFDPDPTLWLMVVDHAKDGQAIVPRRCRDRFSCVFICFVMMSNRVKSEFSW